MSKCLIFDTNALLDLYAFKRDTTEEIIGAIETCDYKIIILPQVYSEFNKKYKENRSNTSERNPINLFKKNYNIQKEKILPLISNLNLNHLSKKYDTKIDTLIEEFSKGVVLADGTKCLPAKLEILSSFVAKVEIREGKYHQIKRMFGTAGLGVNELKRLSIGKLILPQDLEEGKCRELTSEELKNVEG